MVLHWLQTAWRSLVGNPMFSLITIVSLSIGCCGALLAGSVIKQHLSFERNFPDADRIAMVRIAEREGHGAPGTADETPLEFGYMLYPVLKGQLQGNLPGMKAQTRVAQQGSMLADADGKPLRETTWYVDREFFDVFEMPFIEGNPAAAFQAPQNIVLTQEKAAELFGKDAGPVLGKELKGVNGVTLKVGAVVATPPAATHIRFKVLGSFDTLRLVSDPARAARMRYDNWGQSMSGAHYIRIAPDADLTQTIATGNHTIQELANAGFRAENADRIRMATEAGTTPPPGGFIPNTAVVSLLPITKIHFTDGSLTGLPSSGDLTMLTTLATAAAALLAVSSFNYVILSLARSLRRKREVGMRKVLGASGGALVLHYLAEAGVATLISLALGFALAEVLHPWFARTIGQPEALFDLYDPVFAALSIGGFVLLALAVGAYPALYLAHVRPRTGLDTAGTESIGGFGRLITRGLLGLEIAAATALLIVALTMIAQASYVAARPLGFTLKDLIAVRFDCSMRGTPQQDVSNMECQAGLDKAVRETPGVRRIAHSSSPSIFMSNLEEVTRPGGAQKIGESGVMAVDADFLPMAGAVLLAGRMFDANSAYDRQVLDAFPYRRKEKFESVPVIVTRAMLPLIGAEAPQAAIGQRFLIANNWTWSYEIVGVIEDWHQRSLRFAVSPIVFTPGGRQLTVIAEVAPDDLPSVTEALSPANAASRSGGVRLNVRTLQSAFEQTYDADRKLMGAVASFALLAIVVAGLGVYGLAAFDMRRRVKEIGIRKALGASAGKVAGMVMGGQLAFAGIATLAGWPVGYWLSGQWLHGYVYRTDIAWTAPLLASAIILAFVALAVGVTTARAAAVRPGAALRTA